MNESNKKYDLEERLIQFTLLIIDVASSRQPADKFVKKT